MVTRVKKRYERRRVVEVIEEVVRGTEGAVHSRLQQSQRSLTAPNQCRLHRCAQRRLPLPVGFFGTLHSRRST